MPACLSPVLRVSLDWGIGPGRAVVVRSITYYVKTPKPWLAGKNEQGRIPLHAIHLIVKRSEIDRKREMQHLPHAEEMIGFGYREIYGHGDATLLSQEKRLNESLRQVI